MQTQVIQTTERPFSSTVADLDGDGWQDIAVAGFGSDEVAVHLNNGNGVFAPFTAYPVGQAASDIVARDLTNDGFMDLIVTSTGISGLIFSSTIGPALLRWGSRLTWALRQHLSRLSIFRRLPTAFLVTPGPIFS